MSHFSSTALFKLYLAAVCLTGFATLILGNLGGVQAGNLFIDLLALYLFINWVFIVSKDQKVAKGEFFLGSSIILTLSFMILKAFLIDRGDIQMSLQGIRAFMLYILPVLYIIRLAPQKILHAENALMCGFLWLAIFGFLQAVLTYRLPIQLLTPPSDDIFSFGQDTLSVRPTGLIGNPIIFSTVMVLSASWGWSQWLVKRKHASLFLTIISLATIILSYTRAAMIGAIFALVIIYFFYKRLRLLEIIFFPLIAILIFFMGFQWLSSHSDSFISKRLFNNELSTQRSTMGHFKQIEEAKKLIALHPLAGVGLGSQESFSTLTITDGYWWIAALELGLPLLTFSTLFLIVLFFILAYRALTTSQSNRTAMLSIIGYASYIVPASFVNSGGAGRPALALAWILVGLALIENPGLEQMSTSTPAKDAKRKAILSSVRNETLKHLPFRR